MIVSVSARFKKKSQTYTIKADLTYSKPKLDFTKEAFAERVND